MPIENKINKINQTLKILNDIGCKLTHVNITQDHIEYTISITYHDDPIDGIPIPDVSTQMSHINWILPPLVAQIYGVITSHNGEITEIAFVNCPTSIFTTQEEFSTGHRPPRVDISFRWEIRELLHLMV